MRSRKRHLVLLSWSYLAVCLIARDVLSDDAFRNWTTSGGRKSILKMAVVEQTTSTVRLKRQDNGKIVEIPVSQLSRQDRQYLRELAGSQTDDNPFAEATRTTPTVVANDAGENPSNLIRGVQWAAPTLNDANLNEWLTFLRPQKDELKWREIRWHNNLADAAEEARRLKRPILLWTMNGNPCGET